MSQKSKRRSAKRCKCPNTMTGRQRLPPAPEQGNHMRAAIANVAIVAFRAACGVDREDAVGDLLASLMHLCDRDPGLGEFDDRLKLAYRVYKKETATDAEYARM